MSGGEPLQFAAGPHPDKVEAKLVLQFHIHMSGQDDEPKSEGDEQTCPAPAISL